MVAAAVLMALALAGRRASKAVQDEAGYRHEEAAERAVGCLG
jgi:hypothetical protein